MDLNLSLRPSHFGLCLRFPKHSRPGKLCWWAIPAVVGSLDAPAEPAADRVAVFVDVCLRSTGDVHATGGQAALEIAQCMETRRDAPLPVEADAVEQDPECAPGGGGRGDISPADVFVVLGTGRRVRSDPS